MLYSECSEQQQKFIDRYLTTLNPTTSAIDAGYDDETQYLEDDEEINAFIDSVITDDIEGEDDVFQDTIDDCSTDEEFIEDVEDVITDFEDLESLVDNDYIDSLIDGDNDYDY